MIILTAGHTGPNTGAQCAEMHFDEGAENIWLRNRIAEILTNKYGLVVLIDQDTASLKLLVSELNQTSPPLTSPVAQKSSPLELGGVPEGGEGLLSVSSVLSVEDKIAGEATASSVLSVSSARDKENSVRNKNSEGVKSVQIYRAKIANKRGQRSFLQLPSRSNFNEVKSCVARERIEEKEELKSVSSVKSVGDNHSEGVTSVSSVSSVREKENSVSNDDIVIDIHFNAHTNPNARGTEAIVADDATTLELRFAARLAHTTSDALDIPLRCIKSESETPHRRLGMLHLTPQSVILEVCFCTSPEDVEAYRKNREKLAAELAWAIAELLPSVVSTDNRQQSTDKSDR